MNTGSSNSARNWPILWPHTNGKTPFPPPLLPSFPPSLARIFCTSVCIFRLHFPRPDHRFPPILILCSPVSVFLDFSTNFPALIRTISHGQLLEADRRAGRRRAAV